MFAELKRFWEASALYALGDIALKGINLLFLPIIVQYLTAEEYGIFSIADIVRRFASILFGALTAAVISRYYFEIHDEHERRQFFGNIFIFSLFSSLALLLVFSWIGPWLLTAILRQISYTYLWYAILTAFCIAISMTIPLELYRAKERPLAYLGLSLPIFAFQLVGMYYYTVLQNQGVLGLLKGALFGSATLVPIYLLVTIRNIHLNWRLAPIYKAVGFGLPLIPHQLASWGLVALDRILLEQYVPLKEIGVYSFAYQFGVAFGLLVFATNRAWVPFFLRNMQIQDAQTSKINRLVTYYWAMLIIGAVFAVLISDQIIFLLTDNMEYRSAVNLIPWIIGGYLCFGLYSVPATILFFRKRTQYMALSTTIGLASNIILNLSLIPRFGIFAAAVNTFVAYLAMFLVVLLLALKFDHVQFEWIRLVKIFVIASAGYVIVSSIQLTDPWSTMGIRTVLLIVILGMGLTLSGFFLPSERIAVGRFLRNTIGRSAA